MKDPLFSQVYALNPSTNSYIIEIALDRYTDIFDEWDPAPFKRRSIDPDLELYLEVSSEEIPLRYPVELCFKVLNGNRDEKMEGEAKNGLSNSFVFKMYLLKKDLKKSNVQILRWIIYGFVFLWVGTAFPDQWTSKRLLSLLAEALVIGGWVFLWEAVSLFFFTNREIYHHYRLYRRLANAAVRFEYTDLSVPESSDRGCNPSG